MYEPRAVTGNDIIVNEAISFILVMGSPLFALFYWVTYQYFDASLASATTALLSEGLSDFFLPRIPHMTWASAAAYLLWVLFQALLYVYVPGPIYLAPRTPGGRQLTYKLNGFRAWVISVGGAGMASYYGVLNPSVIAVYWGHLLAAANIYSLLLLWLFQIKARVKPDNEGDTLFTGGFIAPYEIQLTKSNS